MAQVIARTGRPALILAHNKTLAAQLYGEMKAFFPNNAVEYFVSYYDYYQPEAYVPRSDTYIERSEEHTSELQSLMRISYAVFCLKKKTTHQSISSFPNTTPCYYRHYNDTLTQTT